MREILFRGKHFDTGEWIYGLPARQPGGVISEIEHLDFGKLTNGVATIEYIEVNPETVCQYTGLTDKNGRKIFEGDIIEVCTFGFNAERFATDVIYDKCAFRLKNGRNMFYCGQSDFSKMDDARIIGNIFDNPNLLKE